MIFVVALFIIMLETFYTYMIIEDCSKAYNVVYMTSRLFFRRRPCSQLEMLIRKLKRKGEDLSDMLTDVANFKLK